MMQHDSDDSSPRQSTSRAAFKLGFASVCLCALACGGDGESLGSGLPGAPSTPNPACPDGIVHDNVTTTSQAQIDALEGCEEINGELSIVAFAGMDLRPLHALRVVHSDLIVGALLPYPQHNLELPIESLAGLESLESVSSLGLYHVSAPDLSSLASLRVVSREASNVTQSDAYVEIANCDNLRDLSGLENLVTWGRLTISEADSLESLNGLVAAQQIGTVQLYDLPKLRDVSALAPALTIQQLIVNQTGLETLPRMNVRRLAYLMIADNPNLRSLEGSNQLNAVDSLLLMDNPLLERLPDWAGLYAPRTIQIVSNDALRSIPSFPATALRFGDLLNGGGPDTPERERTVGFEVIEIANNRQLTDVALPTGISSSAYVGVYGNPSLTDLALGTLEGIDVLWIRDNAALRDVELDELDHVDELHIVDNPALPMEAFAGVRSFESEVSGNASGSGP
jgi:hypothetical protein